MHLYKAALVSAFGGRGQHAYRVMILRLGLVGVLATACGFALARITEQLPLFNFLPAYRLFPSALLVMEIIVLGSLLAASGTINRMYTDRFARWLLLLPIHPLQRWIVLMAPSLVLALLAVLLAAWPFTHLWLRLGAPPHMLILASAGGIVSALGLYHALPPRLVVLRFLFIPYVVWVQYRLVATITSATEDIGMASLYTFITLACVLGLAWLGSKRYTHAAIRHSTEALPVHLSYLPTQCWYIKKCIRSPSIRLSWLTAIILVLAIIAADRSFDLGLPTISLATAVVIAAFVSDIRATSRRIAPAEVTALKGNRHFMIMHSVFALLCGSFIAVPVLLYIRDASAVLLSSVYMGIATGLFAGNALVPAPRDISGQFVSGLLCISMLGLLPHAFNSIADENIQPLLHLGLGTMLLFLTFHIEYKRNPYIWRTPHD